MIARQDTLETGRLIFDRTKPNRRSDARKPIVWGAAVLLPWAVIMGVAWFLIDKFG